MQHQDIIDIRGIIEHVETLREELAAYVEKMDDWQANADAAEELEELEELLSELEGYGGDEQWEGNWYPATLIHEDYFTEYAQELAEDCGMIGRNDKWPYTCIDWEAAAEELKQDYSTVEFDGHTYYYR